MDVKSMCQGRQSVVDLNYGVSNLENNVHQADSETMPVQIQGNTSNDVVNLIQGGNKSAYKTNERTIGEKEVKDAVDKLNKLFEGKDTHVEYEIIGKLRQMSIKIINDKTKEVIKEVPPKKIVEMIDKLCELAGILVDEKA